MYNSVTEYIKTLFSLYIIFYDEKNECRDLKDLEKHISKPITLSDYNELCKKDESILECYLKFIIDAQNKSDENDDIKVDVVNQFKEQFKKILSSLEGKDIQKEELNKFYCFIFDKINMLKQNINSESNKIKERCNKEQSAGGKQTGELIKNETVLETTPQISRQLEKTKKNFW